ncbi:MAG: DUF4416 family protein [Fibrobacteria bacterium]|nr:DUF4416 family protein [Fibrobacteria bacterium]
MGQLTQPSPVKLIIGLLGQNQEILEETRKHLAVLYGKEEEILSAIPFIWTNYYEQEIGTSPVRSFIAYENLIPRMSIVDIKRKTNELENKLCKKGLRPVNIDPGYMTLGQFFLATTKDQRQRVYLGKGIFLEVTLFFKDGNFHPFNWTYRDYQSDKYLTYFLKVRSKLAYQLRNGRPYSQRKARSL